jgi:antirestriction protein ArdC
VTGEHYRGINVLLLWITAQERGYRGDTWMTFNQAKEFGASVRKGEKGTPIVFFKALTVTKDNAETGQDEERQVPMIRTYTVFNVAQIEGLPAHYYPAAPAPIEPITSGNARNLPPNPRCAVAARSSTKAAPARSTRPARIRCRCPISNAETAGGYVATLAHELCHWTGHKSRLARKFTGQFGSKDYAAEELVAEIGAAFIGAQLGILGDHIDSHAAYIGSGCKPCAMTSALFSRPPASPRPPPIWSWPTPSSNAPPAPPDPQPTAGAQGALRAPAVSHARPAPDHAARQDRQRASHHALPRRSALPSTAPRPRAGTARANRPRPSGDRAAPAPRGSCAGQS